MMLAKKIKEILMKNEPVDPDFVADSVLTTKAIGSAQDVESELQLPDGKNIAELLDDQKEKENTNDIT